MSKPDLLDDWLARAAQRAPDSVAVVYESQTLSYAQLQSASDSLASQLVQQGVKPQDRVALLLPKSPDAIIALFGILKAGAAYVPIDLFSPPARQHTVLRDCRPSALVASAKILEGLIAAEPKVLDAIPVVVCREPLRVSSRVVVWSDSTTGFCGTSVSRSGSDPAYVLYTSGTTGVPKGVIVSHEGAVAFVDWAQRTFAIQSNDRLVSHAQLSFDLSILDIFGSVAAGAQVHLIPPSLALRPIELRDFVVSRGITIWYSVPSALVLLTVEGRLSERPPPSLKRVLFAGEVFPLNALRRLLEALPGSRFYNLYGPTETNVCTYYEVPSPLPQDRESIPLGGACDHLQVVVLSDEGLLVEPGVQGEICVAGPSVLLGYFNRPDQTASRFWPPGTVTGIQQPLYRTGDLAWRDNSGLLWFVGRRDRQVKRRGYRIELAEVEAALSSLAGVREAAVAAEPCDGHSCVLRAVLVPEPGAKLTITAVKIHCGKRLPAYMVPDRIEFVDTLPRTTTGKLNLEKLP